jgi:hypothetical protein
VKAALRASYRPSSPLLSSLLLALGLGCARTAPVASGPGALPADGAAQSSSGALPAGQGVPPGAAGGGQAGFPQAPLPGGEEPTPDRALPELRVEALGMHVGGGKNDAEEKAPFHRALERQFPAFLECYRLAEEPLAGGSFGVDIKVPRAGGPPSVEQPRTKIRGGGFRECMLAAVSRAQFERPKAGPTVISYSVRFTLGNGKR